MSTLLNDFAPAMGLIAGLAVAVGVAHRRIWS